MLATTAFTVTGLARARHFPHPMSERMVRHEPVAPAGAWEAANSELKWSWFQGCWPRHCLDIAWNLSPEARLSTNLRPASSREVQIRRCGVGKASSGSARSASGAHSPRLRRNPSRQRPCRSAFAIDRRSARPAAAKRPVAAGVFTRATSATVVRQLISAKFRKRKRD